jgi:hypothetical protein
MVFQAKEKCAWTQWADLKKDFFHNNNPDAQLYLISEQFLEKYYGFLAIELPSVRARAFLEVSYCWT